MRKFNPEKELYKIQHGNRNKIIFGVIALLLIIAVGSSYALYQIRYSKRIIYTKVAPFYSKDINILAIYLDDELTDKFPEKGSKVAFDKVVCDNGSTGAFNTNTWELILKSKGKDKCNVYFRTTTDYIDDSGANPPELYQGLIPVTLSDGGKIHVANLTENWYDYDEKRWANAVLINASDTTIKNKYFDENNNLKTDIFGDEIPISEILQMYVWVPRYKYQLFNVNNEGVEEQEIKIEFESGTLSTGTVECNISDIGVESCNNAIKGEWYTHPAFTFGSTELKGLWVGKFEPSEKNKGTTGTINVVNAPITDITILPNKVSTTNRIFSTMFQATRDIETNSIYNLNSEEVDTHMMKNMEWGAVAYLSQSIYGIFDKSEDGIILCSLDNTLNEQTCRIWNNNHTHGNTSNWDGAITGCSGASANAAELLNQTSCSSGRTWNTTEGQKASTTGNLYGVYDMAGGAWENVIGNMANSNGVFYGSEAGFSVALDSRYYDAYEYEANNYLIHYRSHLGDAIREVLKIFGDVKGGWNGDYAFFPYGTWSWFARGGRGLDTANAGVFATNLQSGKAMPDFSFRVVLTAQDGEE